MSLFSHDDDDQEDRLDALRSPKPGPRQFEDKFQAPPLREPEKSEYEFPYSPVHGPEESEPDMVTLSCRRDDPILEALVEATGKDAEILLACALQIGIDFIKVESMEALTGIYEMRLAGLEARLKALKEAVQEAGTPTEPPKSRMELWWALLTDKEKD